MVLCYNFDKDLTFCRKNLFIVKILVCKRQENEVSMMEKTRKEIDSVYLRQIYFECEYKLWDGEECKRLKEKKKKISQKPMFSF